MEDSQIFSPSGPLLLFAMQFNETGLRAGHEKWDLLLPACASSGGIKPSIPDNADIPWQFALKDSLIQLLYKLLCQCISLFHKACLGRRLASCFCGSASFFTADLGGCEGVLAIGTSGFTADFVVFLGFGVNCSAAGELMLDTR